MKIKGFARVLSFLRPLLFAAGSVTQGKFICIDHTNSPSVTGYPREQLDKIGRLKWYFAHASVGANLMDGISDLHQLAPSSCQLRDIPANAAPPPATEPGAIYGHNRGNPGWKAKFDTFGTCVSHGWRFPAVNIVINKLCYIDQKASLRYYLSSMTNLESAYPETAFVYTTMPLTTAEDADNYLRNLFNTRLREWCRTVGRVLFDLADLEAHDPAGVPCPFTFRGKSWQRLCNTYTTDGGHLNPEGRQQVARGFYALGNALVAECARETH